MAIDPNVNFDAALAEAVRRQQAARQEPDQPRDDTGEPDEQPGTGSRRPLAQQILEEQQAPEPQPRDPDSGQYVPRDPLARFGSSPVTAEQEQFDDEPVELPGEPEPEPEPEQPMILGKFRSPEELERSYVQLEQFMGERHATENELRQQVADLSARLNMVSSATQQKPMMQPELSPDAIDSRLDRDGVEFLAELYENEHPSYEAALDRMIEVSPRTAIDWTSRVAAWEAAQELRGELAPQIASVSAPVTRDQSQARWNSAWRDLANSNPEMTVLSEVMMNDLEQNPHIALPMKEGIADAEKVVLESLLVRARDANRELVSVALAEQGEQAGREKTEAQVAHASVGAARTSGQGDQVNEAIRRLKAGVLGQSESKNVHEAIAASRRGS